MYNIRNTNICEINFYIDVDIFKEHTIKNYTIKNVKNTDQTIFTGIYIKLVTFEYHRENEAYIYIQNL